MKKSLFILTVISLLMIVKVYSQNKDLLIRYDEEALKKAAENVHYSDYNKVELYNRDLFRAYREQKGVALDFSEKDYRDAQTNVKNLSNEVEKLNIAKKKAEDDLSIEKRTAGVIKADKDSLQKENNNLKDQLLSKTKTEKEIEAKDKRIQTLEKDIFNANKVIDSLKTIIQGKDVILAQLYYDTARIGNEKRVAIREKEETLSMYNSLQTQLNNKNMEIQNLSESNKYLSKTNDEFQKAFNETKEAINAIYQANIVKPIAEMDPEQLDKARSKFEGMKSLLIIDQGLYKDLESKVNEISSWRALVVPMKSARQYLKGKYDDKKRKEYIAAINKVSISGSKTNEKQSMLDNLNNQYQLKDIYDKIVGNLNEIGCLPDIEQLQGALDMLNRQKGKVTQFYRPNVFDSYDRGMQMIESELSKPAPSDKVKTATEFNKFIQELKDIF